ncbi:cytochrome P450 [Coprinopsis marcescibilis]|uniref:Cytochrome P450 n=1 Tax=Coprinopsis marcescibilis TaxID=230819 RepID=A0A5C3KL83_COPMA|nr:cytochrome P450 [Coprinopsis marcescibilis]
MYCLGRNPSRGFSNGIEFQGQVQQKYGTVSKLSLQLGAKGVLVSDPKALYHIFVKDQDVFEETSVFISLNKVVFGDSLLATSGNQHKRQRKMLNPVFSIKHMRDMIPTFTGVSNKARDTLTGIVSEGPKEIEFFRWLNRIALELIGQSGLGYSFDPLTEASEDHPLISSIKSLVPVATKLMWTRVYLIPFVQKWNLGGKRLQRFVVDKFGWKDAHDLRDIVDVMHKSSTEIFESKKAALAAGDDTVAQQIGQGKDILSILSNVAGASKGIYDNLIPLNRTFVFAAMDTTSSALARILYLLSERQDVQDRLRKEIREARAQYGELDFDQLMNLPYLDAICRETLRLYPPVPLVFRETTKPAVLPFSNPINGTSGKVIHEVLIPTGTRILASISNSNCNPELWGPDAREWKPERWLSPLPSAVTEAKIPGVYSNMMTFIGGGRACIGFKFSQLEMKIVLFTLLERLKFESTDQEISWNMSTIVFPSVGPDPMKSALPLVVSIAPN